MKEPPEDLVSPDDQRAEYIDASNNMRMCSTLRFAQLTLFLAGTAALLSVLFSKDSVAPKQTLKIAGLVIVAVFFVFEERTTGFWQHYKDRAKVLEEKMGCWQYRLSANHPIPFRATWAARLLFFAAALFWSLSLAKLF
jgi:hypothetical protein